VTGGVVFVAPLPPPVHGFATVCAAMLARFRKEGQVEVFDRAIRSNKLGVAMLRQVIMALRYLVSCRRYQDAVLYLGLSGGLGQVMDLFYVLGSKSCRRPMFIHHHSYAYINASTIVNKLLFFYLRRESHIVLSVNMGAALEQMYRLDANKIKVVSNAAFYAPAAGGSRKAVDTNVPIQVGFLSNITFDKGFVEFFSVLARLRQQRVAYVGHIAGPISRKSRYVFDELLLTSSPVKYAGPIFGEAKDQFLQNLNILLFPTKYANEAEPLVIHEALRSGVYVIACDRGAISEILGNGAGIVLSQEKFVDAAVTHIINLSADRARLEQAQNCAFVQAQRIHESATIELGKVLSDIKNMCSSRG
jgi:glycosyltransferase involved in cell wall biosynthesis